MAGGSLAECLLIIFFIGSYQGKQLKVREILELPEKVTPRKRKYRGPKSGAKRPIIPIKRLLWNDCVPAETSLASRQSHAAKNRTFSLLLDSLNRYILTSVQVYTYNNHNNQR
jgi:hypothetical protein